MSKLALAQLSMLLLLFAPGSVAAQPGAITGDLHRSYVLPEANASIPYRVFVPSSYDGTEPYPLIVVLHGAGQTADRVIETPGLRETAEAKRVILVAPLGYSPFGGYGDIYPVVVTRANAAMVDQLRELSKPGAQPTAAAPAATPHSEPAAPDDGVVVPVLSLTDPVASRLSEQDTMTVLGRVREELRIDPTRIYLMGNSMGGLGTAYLAARYPRTWAAISPSGGPFAAWSYPYFQLREHGIPALFVHGDHDEHAHWVWSERIVERARKEGVAAELRVVENGNHSLAWTKVLPETFDFLLRHRNSEPAPAAAD